MSKWRPEGWKGYHRTALTAHNTEEEIFEAGADALLSELRRQGVQASIYTSEWTHKSALSYKDVELWGKVDQFPVGIKCRLVLIPDEPEKEEKER